MAGNKLQHVARLIVLWCCMALLSQNTIIKECQFLGTVAAVVESCNGYHSCNKMPTVDFPFCFFVTSVLDMNSNRVPNMYYKVRGLYLFSCRIFVLILHVLCTCIDLCEYLVPK